MTFTAAQRPPGGVHRHVLASLLESCQVVHLYVESVTIAETMEVKEKRIFHHFICIPHTRVNFRSLLNNKVPAAGNIFWQLLECFFPLIWNVNALFFILLLCCGSVSHVRL